MKKRIILAISLLSLILLAGGMGYLLGNMNVEVEYDNENQQPVMVENEDDDAAEILPIVLVNLDEGMMLDGERIFYAQEMIRFPDVDIPFLYTSLSDARQGVEQGRYAAYIIIPATFSESIYSLNDTPTAATLSYVLSSTISMATQRDTIYAILSFSKELNNDVSFMYLANVLREFHRMQDNSGIIMNNDLITREAINNVQGRDLIQLVQLPTLAYEEHVTEHLDVSGLVEQNMQLLNEIDETNAHQLSEQLTHLLALQREGHALNDALDTLFGNVNLTTGEDDLSMILNGQEILRSSLETYLTQIDERINDIDVLISQLADDVDNLGYDAANMPRLVYEINQPEHLVLSVEDVYGWINPSLSISINDNEEIIDELITDLVLLQDFTNWVLAAPPTETVESLMERIYTDGNISISDLAPAVANPATVPPPTLSVSDIPTFIDAFHEHQLAGLALIQDPLIQSVEETLSELQISVDEFENIKDAFKDDIIENFRSDFILPLLGNVETALNQQNASGRAHINHFQNEANQFNPNLDRTVSSQNTSLIHSNKSEMNQLLFENNQTHMTSANEAQSVSIENVTTLQGFIVEAMQLSNAGIEEGLQSAQETQVTKSEHNQTLLSEFTQMLPFTRIGTQEHTQAYQFMTNPIHFVGEHSQSVGNNIVPETLSTLTADTVNHIATIAYILAGGVLLTFIVVLVMKEKATATAHQAKDTKIIS